MGEGVEVVGVGEVGGRVVVEGVGWGEALVQQLYLSGTRCTKSEPEMVYHLKPVCRL